MAGPNPDDRDREQHHQQQQQQPHPKPPSSSDSTDNPFINFRRFADQQVSSLLNTFSQIPSALSSSFNDRPRYTYRDNDTRQRELERSNSGDEGYSSRGHEELGPFERMFRDMERAMEQEEKELEKLFRDAEEARKRGEEHSAESHEPKVWYWSWSWPPKSKEEREREREEWKREMQDRAQHWQHVWDFPGWGWGHRHHARRAPWGDEGEGLYEEWEDYLLHDKYSPLQLERSQELAGSRINWRDAYEDLLSKTVQSQIGLSAGPLYNSNALERKYLTPLQWIHQLQRRHDSLMWDIGLGVPSRPSFFGHWGHDWHQRGCRNSRRVEDSEKQISNGDSHKAIPWTDSTQTDSAASETAEAQDQHPHDSTNESDSEPQTELDMYERFLGSSSDTAAPESSSAVTTQSDARATSTPAIEKSTILSTLTTTERTVQPDGTVTTKVVLKKRFADGREESSETVHTTRADAEQFGNANNTSQKNEKGKGSGWFWSN